MAAQDAASVQQMLQLAMLLDECYVGLMLTMTRYEDAAKSIASMMALHAAFPSMLDGMAPSIHLSAGLLPVCF